MEPGEETRMERHKIEWKFYTTIVECATTIIVVLILWGIIDNLATRFGPIRPQVQPMYAWPVNPSSKPAPQE